jgi:DNA-binding transcriptional LysR family regulator
MAANARGRDAQKGGGMGFDTWDEVRTAFQVARLGTVSGAAEVLGVHHATVIRHVDALERRLGTKLFQRHARGYTPTEAGRDLLLVAQTTEDQFSQLASRIKGQGETVSGELVVTSISGLTRLMMPVFEGFQRAYPEVRVRFLADTRVFRLEYGEAHVAIRAGAAPEEPDNVVQPLARMRSALFAAESYVQARGLPRDESDFAHHRFVGADSEATRAPFHRWLRDRIAPEAYAFRATDPLATEEAVRRGLGIGFLSASEGAHDPSLVQVMPPRPEWESPLWLVTHVDLHRTTKVQAFVTHIKEAARGWVGL